MSQPEHSDSDEYTESEKEELDRRAADVLDDEGEEWLTFEEWAEQDE